MTCTNCKAHYGHPWAFHWKYCPECGTKKMPSTTEIWSRRIKDRITEALCAGLDRTKVLDAAFGAVHEWDDKRRMTDKQPGGDK